MTRRRIAALVVAAALLGAACGGDGRARDGADTGATEPSADDWIARTDSDALFSVDCGFSHRASDDPIVWPGAPGRSHGHEFFGSGETDAHSTGEALIGTATSCREPGDTAAYWVPTLSVDGVPVDPGGLRAYYRAAVGVDVRDVAAPPLGLAMISGDPSGGTVGHDHGDAPETTSEVGTPVDDAPADEPGVERRDGGSGAEGHDHVAAGGVDAVDAGWGCGMRPRRVVATPPTDCVRRSPLTLHLRFPDCWDGERLDSEDHRSHVAHSVDGACPATHPVLMTQVQLTVWWPVFGAAAARVELSSGPVEGAHGDFLNGWDPDVLAHEVELCVHAKANCTVG